MQRLGIRVEVESFYSGAPANVLRRGLDYEYRGAQVAVKKHGVECLGWRVESARRVRRSLRRNTVPTCPSASYTSISSLECDTILVPHSPHPEPIELLNIVYAGFIYALIEEGRISVTRIARLYETGSCALIEGGFWWRLLEEQVGRRPLRLSTIVDREAQCEYVHAAVAHLYPRNRLRLERTRCYLGAGRGCKAVYEAILPEEVVGKEPIRVLARAVRDARRKLYKQLQLGLIELQVECDTCIRAGAGSWPFNSIVALAALNDLVRGEIVDTIFSAYKRCGGVKPWPPRRVEVVVADDRLMEPGLLRLEALT